MSQARKEPASDKQQPKVASKLVQGLMLCKDTACAVQGYCPCHARILRVHSMQGYCLCSYCKDTTCAVQGYCSARHVWLISQWATAVPHNTLLTSSVGHKETPHAARLHLVVSIPQHAAQPFVTHDAAKDLPMPKHAS
jgi:hypothetical protein